MDSAALHPKAVSAFQGRKWFLFALFNFFLAACLGALMRYAFVEEVSWMKFRNVLHGHSHVAMLGWIYLALYALLIAVFLPPEKQARPFYERLFWLTQLSVFGMLVAFPIQGYAGFSIAFSSLHVVLTYAFIWQFLRDLKPADGSVSLLFLRWSLAFMLISTLALWLLVPVMVWQFHINTLYYQTIQAFLHFQFNGWYIFAFLALGLRLLEQKGLQLPKASLRWIMPVMILSVFMTYALAVSWASPHPAIFAINSIGVVLQLIAFGAFGILLRKHVKELKLGLSPTVSWLWKIALACLVMKILAQSAVVVPDIARVAYTIRNFVIGFIHLILLGAITHFLFGYARYVGWIDARRPASRLGLWLFVFAFFASELVLFGQGLLLWVRVGFIPSYYEIIFVVSALLPLALSLLLLGQRKFR